MQINRIVIFLCFLTVTLAVLLIGGGAFAKAECEPSPKAVIYREETKDPLSDFVFFGDSTVAHMQSRAPIPDKSRVWTTKSRYLNLDGKVTLAKILDPDGGAEIFFSEALQKYKPKRLFLTLGIDHGVYYYRDKPSTFRKCYESLLDLIARTSPDTEVFLGAIFPVARECKSITNEMVDNANKIIAEIALARSLPFVDCNTPLKNSDGYLSSEYCYSADGIHLTNSAYTVIVDTLKNCVGPKERLGETT